MATPTQWSPVSKPSSRMESKSPLLRCRPYGCTGSVWALCVVTGQLAVHTACRRLMVRTMSIDIEHERRNE
jgi:hypothetical protein